MNELNKCCRVVPKSAWPNFTKQHTSCLIMDASNRYLLQKRPSNWRTFPGYLCMFGGEIEYNESPVEAMIRELKEELEVSITPNELIYIASITELISGHCELIHQYCYKDIKNEIKRTTEGELVVFDNKNDILKEKKIMDDLIWQLTEL